MKKWMKVALTAVVIIVVIVGLGVLLSHKFGLATQKQAQQRALQYADAVNYARGGEVYDLLCKDIRSLTTREQFHENFLHERSFPYLTPFYINFESIEMGEGNKTAVAHFSVAARLAGDTFDLPLVYENGNYYCVANESIADGSYIAMFDNLEIYDNLLPIPQQEGSK